MGDTKATVLAASANLLDVIADLRSTNSTSVNAYTSTAVKYFALGAGHSLEDITVTACLVNAVDVRNVVETGITAAGRRDSVTPKTVQNYVSAIRRLVAELESRVGDRPLLPIGTLQRMAKSRFTRPKSTRKVEICEEVGKAIEEYVKLRRSIPMPTLDEFGEDETSFGPLRHSTTVNQRSLLRRYVQVATTALGGTRVSLEDMIKPETLKVVHKWYATENARVQTVEEDLGSERVVLSANTSIVAMIETLIMFIAVYIREHRPDLYRESVRLGTHKYFRAARRRLKKAVVEDGMQMKPDVSALTPNHLTSFRAHYLDSLTRTAMYGEVNFGSTSGLRYRRTCLGIVMLAEAPLRIKNVLELRIGRQLSKEDGVYRIRIPAKELKNKGAGKRGVDYHRRLSPRLTELIDAYMDEVRSVRGDDYFTTSPLFSAVRSNSVTLASSSTLRGDISLLFEYIHKHRFSPHRARDVIATHLIAWGPINGLDGIVLAAEALGDTVKTVVDKYYKGPTGGLDVYTKSLW